MAALICWLPEAGGFQLSGSLGFPAASAARLA